jgi:hypothetical protein
VHLILGFGKEPVSERQIPVVLEEYSEKLMSDTTRSQRPSPHATFARAFAGRSLPKKPTVVRSYRVW